MILIRLKLNHSQRLQQSINQHGLGPSDVLVSTAELCFELKNREVVQKRNGESGHGEEAEKAFPEGRRVGLHGALGPGEGYVAGQQEEARREPGRGRRSEEPWNQRSY